MQVVLDAIEELCYEMGLHSMEGMDEYAVFLVTNRGENVFTNGHHWNNEFLLTKWVKRMWPI